MAAWTRWARSSDERKPVEPLWGRLVKQAGATGRLGPVAVQ
jgi:hypothetical protein